MARLAGVTFVLLFAATLHVSSVGALVEPTAGLQNASEKIADATDKVDDATNDRFASLRQLLKAVTRKVTNRPAPANNDKSVAKEASAQPQHTAGKPAQHNQHKQRSAKANHATKPEQHNKPNGRQLREAETVRVAPNKHAAPQHSATGKVDKANQAKHRQAAQRNQAKSKGRQLLEAVVSRPAPQYPATHGNNIYKPAEHGDINRHATRLEASSAEWQHQQQHEHQHEVRRYHGPRAMQAGSRALLQDSMTKSVLALNNRVDKVTNTQMSVASRARFANPNSRQLLQDTPKKSDIDAATAAQDFHEITHKIAQAEHDMSATVDDRFTGRALLQAMNHNNVDRMSINTNKVIEGQSKVAGAYSYIQSASNTRFRGTRSNFDLPS